MSRATPRFSMRVLTRTQDYVAFNERADFTTVDFRDVLSSRPAKKRLEVSGAVLGNGNIRTRLPRNFTPVHLDSERRAYGAYNIYEAAHWEGGKLHRWGIPAGYRMCKAKGRDRKGRLIAIAWREDPEYGDDDAFVYQSGKFHLLRKEVGRGDGSIINQQVELWRWDTNMLISLPALKGYTYGSAKPGLSPNEYVGGLFNMGPGIACHWNQGRCTVLPLPKGTVRASACGLSRQGWIVGAASGDSPWFSRGVLWHQGRVLLLQNCIAHKGWQIGEVFGITPRGVIFVSVTKDTDTERVSIPMLAALYPV